MRFEWDPDKATRNVARHGVSFDAALSVFGDPMAVTFADIDHTEAEDRSRTFGAANRARVPVVVHTERREAVRIISPRKATRHEKSIYANG